MVVRISVSPAYFSFTSREKCGANAGRGIRPRGVFSETIQALDHLFDERLPVCAFRHNVAEDANEPRSQLLGQVKIRLPCLNVPFTSRLLGIVKSDR